MYDYSKEIDLIQHGQTKECLYLLIGKFKNVDSDTYNKYVLLFNRLEQIEDKSRLETVSNDEARIEINKINNSILNMINAKPSVKQEIVRNKKNIRYVIAATLFISFFCFLLLYIWRKIESDAHVMTMDEKLTTAKNYLGVAIDFRVKNEIDSSILYCTKSIDLYPKNHETYNTRAECYIMKFVEGERGNPSNIDNFLKLAREDALKALYYNPIDREDGKEGFINSTLAQIASLGGDENMFFKYLTDALENGFKVWEYQTQPGFNEYKDNKKYLDLIAKFKKKKKKH